MVVATEQPGSTLSRWFHERVGDRRGKIRRITIVAVARKLLIALWRYVTLGLVPEGAERRPKLGRISLSRTASNPRVNLPIRRIQGWVEIVDGRGSDLPSQRDGSTLP